ncbi:unnamed protein product [Amoebophrya sp. A120]|nr:unnamed protein product [Amoebophrya sp. A120]|eukprot:GSA120T00010145001.1
MSDSKVRDEDYGDEVEVDPTSLYRSELYFSSNDKDREWRAMNAV